MNPIQPSFALLAALLTTLATGATPAQEPVRSEARAEARATGSQTVTHRVVVVNGKTIVDEKTVNGKKVPAKGRVDTPPPGIDPTGIDPEEMLRKMRERMRRAAGKGLPGLDLPGLDLPGKGTSQRSSHTRRKVVENGKVIVDEETRDGKPVRGADKGRSDRPVKQVDGEFGDLEVFDRRRPTGLGLDRARKLERRSDRSKDSVQPKTAGPGR